MKCKLSFLFLFFLSSTLFCESSWILGAAAFEIKGETENGVISSMSEQLPLLILENISLPEKRRVDTEESRDRKKEEMGKSRDTLFTKIEQKVLSRDSILFNKGLTPQSKKEIALLEKEIHELINSYTNLKDSYLHLETAVYPDSYESIEFWKNDSSQLYQQKEKVTDINGLIIGSIQEVNSFVRIEVQLLLYPGNRVQKEIVKTGSLLNFEQIAQDISSELTAYITNRKMVQLSFDITSEDLNSVTIKIDDSIFNRTQEYAVVPEGYHSIWIDAPGYKTRIINWNFTGKEKYRILVKMEKEIPVNLVFQSSDKDSEIFLNGLPSTGYVNSLPVLGKIILPDLSSSFFYVQQRKNTILESDNSYAVLLEDPVKDLNTLIEKSRKRMYSSYGLLLISLPFSLISYGNYVNEYTSWFMGYSSGNGIKSAEKTFVITSGISVGLGINFVIQLGRYIFNVNKVLPQEIYVE